MKFQIPYYIKYLSPGEIIGVTKQGLWDADFSSWSAFREWLLGLPDELQAAAPKGSNLERFVFDGEELFGFKMIFDRCHIRHGSYKENNYVKFEHAENHGYISYSSYSAEQAGRRFRDFLQRDALKSSKEYAIVDKLEAMSGMDVYRYLASIVKKYGVWNEYGKSYVLSTRVSNDWNAAITGFILKPESKRLLMKFWWGGDSTDGEEWVDVDHRWFMYGGTLTAYDTRYMGGRGVQVPMRCQFDKDDFKDAVVKGVRLSVKRRFERDHPQD